MKSLLSSLWRTFWPVYALIALAFGLNALAQTAPTNAPALFPLPPVPNASATPADENDFGYLTGGTVSTTRLVTVRVTVYESLTSNFMHRVEFKSRSCKSAFAITEIIHE